MVRTSSDVVVARTTQTRVQARFIPTTRGPKQPPPLGLRIEFRPEGRHPWFAVWADGSVAAVCSTLRAAQEALGGVTRKVGTDG